MNKIESWGFSDDKTIEFKSLTKEYLEGALLVMSNVFFVHENVCKAISLGKEPGAIEELLELCRHAANDGVSLVAIDRSNNKVVGAMFNKLQVNETSGEPYFEKFSKTCKYPEAKYVVEFMLSVDTLCNLFELTKSNCIMELMFLATAPESRGKGIAKKLCELSLDLVNKLNNGINVKTSINGEDMPLEPLPKATSAIFTSFITQKIGRQLDFKIAVERSYELYSFNGKKLSEVIGEQTPVFTLEYKLIN